jgi:hypothetical protein
VSGLIEFLPEVPKLGTSAPASAPRGTFCASGVQSNEPRSSPFSAGRCPSKFPSPHIRRYSLESSKNATRARNVEVQEDLFQIALIV